MLLALSFLASIIVGAMYATSGWMFAFAPTSVDELTIHYRQTHEQVKLSAEQVTTVLSDLRQAEEYFTLVDIASQPGHYVVSHELIAREGHRIYRYYVFWEQGLVTDSDYQNPRQLGQETSQLIKLLKPSLPGQMDLLVPGHIAQADGRTLPFTRYILPVAYRSPDFRVYTSGAWDIDWHRQAMVLAAWGQRPSNGHRLQIVDTAIVGDWLRIAVDYAAPGQFDPAAPPSFPADAVLLEREQLKDLRGVCFVDQAGTLFASQALGKYPVERHLSRWKGDCAPAQVPASGQGMLAELLDDEQVKTMVLYYNFEVDAQPVIKQIVEVAPGDFHVYVSYQPGDRRFHAVLISGYGSTWRFRVV